MFVGSRGVWGGVWYKRKNRIFVFLLVSVSNMLWSRQQRAFALKAHFSKGLSMIAVKYPFCRHIDISPRGRVPDQKYVLMWMDACILMWNVSKERKGPPKTIRAPENVE
ncbi:DUF4817 domain-containing protein [Trichonephila clavipes]|nr:DUF4817 domain-containing protein [Trichonephila clavipes]